MHLLHWTCNVNQVTKFDFLVIKNKNLTQSPLLLVIEILQKESILKVYVCFPIIGRQYENIWLIGCSLAVHGFMAYVLHLLCFTITT